MNWNEVKVAQSCLTLCDPMDCTVHGILQARILECVTFPFSRGSSQPRDQTHVSCIAGRFFTSWATREAPGQMRICDSVLFLMLFPLFKITFPIFFLLNRLLLILKKPVQNVNHSATFLLLWKEILSYTWFFLNNGAHYLFTMLDHGFPW